LVSLSQISKSPERNSGKALAVLGIIMGGISVTSYVVWFIWLILSFAFG